MILLLGICQALTTNIGSFFKVWKKNQRQAKKDTKREKHRIIEGLDNKTKD